MWFRASRSVLMVAVFAVFCAIFSGGAFLMATSTLIDRGFVAAVCALPMPALVTWILQGLAAMALLVAGTRTVMALTNPEVRETFRLTKHGSGHRRD